MEYTTVELDTRFEHRYKFFADLYGINHNGSRIVSVFVDLGCYNTMIPKYLAEESGRPLGFTRDYRIGGHTITAEAFSIDKIVIKNVALERVLAFAADFSGEHADDILLGTNVMNNWEMIIHKKSGTFKFREDPPDSLPNKAYMYQNYFDNLGNYVCIQENA